MCYKHLYVITKHIAEIPAAMNNLHLIVCANAVFLKVYATGLFITNYPLTFTNLLATSADDKLVIFFLSPSLKKKKKKKKKKKNFTFHANCPKWIQFAWFVKSCFLKKRIKQKSTCRLLKIFARVLGVKQGSKHVKCPCLRIFEQRGTIFTICNFYVIYASNLKYTKHYCACDIFRKAETQFCSLVSDFQQRMQT